MKKILCMLLAVLMVLPILAACQDTKTDPKESETAAQTAGEFETADPFDPGVPYTDYDEHEFLIMCPMPDDWGIASYDRQEETSEQVNDAIYARNRQLEDKFNIKFNTVGAGYTGTQAEAFQPFAMSGEDVVDMIAVGFYQSGKPLIVQDYVLPWNDVKYINLDKPWWNKSVSQTLSILGNYYYLVGDVNWFTMPETAVCFFNKNVADNNNKIIDESGKTMYDLVDEGEWTFDRLYNIAKQISTDNGDGVWDENDTYGCIQNTVIGVSGFVPAAGYQTVYMTDNGPVLNFSTARLATIIEYLYNLCCVNNISYTETFAVGLNGSSESKGVPAFFDDRALYYFDTLRNAETFRAYDSDFGIIPYPKYDKEQKDYIAYADQWGLCCALPCTASDTARTGEILEAMCALSRKLIVPAYYDKTLMGKIKRDDESEPMLDIIFSNVLYDFGTCFCTDLGFIIGETFVKAKTKDLTSWYKSHRKKLEHNYMELAVHVYEQIHDGETPEWSTL